VKKPLPNYPQAAYTWHRQGSGWFRLNIDPVTGKVTSVKVLKSTGVKMLDDCAAVTFMQWRAKPHLIDHAILPADFVGAHGDNKAIRW
jgi:TonB family protein